MAAKLSIDFAQEQEQGYERVFAKRPMLTNLALDWNGIEILSLAKSLQCLSDNTFILFVCVQHRSHSEESQLNLQFH